MAFVIAAVVAFVVSFLILKAIKHRRPKSKLFVENRRINRQDHW